MDVALIHISHGVLFSAFWVVSGVAVLLILNVVRLFVAGAAFLVILHDAFGIVLSLVGVINLDLVISPTSQFVPLMTTIAEV